MHTSGLVLDVYDDVVGEQLKAFFPSATAVPDLVKQAHSLSPQDISRLPDDAFALVLVNGEDRLRKFACVDEGNTALSVLYFVKNAHKLPDEARVRAAENLKIACGWYGLDVPEELEKEAGLGAYIAQHPVQSIANAVMLPSLAGGVRDGARANLARVREGERMDGAAGGLGAMAHGIEHVASADLDLLAEAFKTAEATGTDLMPISKNPHATAERGPEQTIKKTSSTGRLVSGHRGEQGISPDVAAPVAGKNPVRAPQHMNPVVDATGKEPRKEMKEKKASYYALPSYGRYPLDSYEQVKQASAYFETYADQMSPVDRHEYCVNLVKRASALSVSVGDRARKYGSEKYASAGELELALDMRRVQLDSKGQQLLDKVAAAMPSLSPGDFAAVLGEFDQAHGLHHQYDRTVYDPYYTTFGFQKTASEDPESWSDVVGNYHVTGSQLKHFADNHWMRLKAQFGMDFAEEFKKDPIAIYSSMPTEQKILIIRMATENSPTN